MADRAGGHRPSLPRTPHDFADSDGYVRSLDEVPRLKSERVNRERLSVPDFRTRFHGRTAEIAELRQWLRRARLITLVGAGGIGKTRLAIEVASLVAADFMDGVRLLDFTPVHGGEQVPSAMASGLGLQVARPKAVLAQLADALAARHLLVILDNCEHVLDAVAEVADVVTRECPAVTVMATSRQPLGLRGEVTYSVPPLAIETEAVPMFIERASAANRMFRVDPKKQGVVASVCSQLEGLPLAIELTAPLMRVMSVQELMGRLVEGVAVPTADWHDLPVRQRTMRATVDWSYRLLPAPEQHLFRRLAVFNGPFTFDAASAVAASDPLHADSLVHLMAGLCDASMFNASEAPSGVTRYRILEVLREYGLEQMRVGDEEPELRRRHFEHYLRRAELAGEQRASTGSDTGFVELALDGDQMRAALKWALDNDPEGGLRLAGALDPIWMMGAVSEGGEWIRLGLARAPSRTRHRAIALLSVALIAAQASWRESRTQIEEGLSIFAELGDERGQSMALLTLGMAAWYSGELEIAQRHLAVALERHLRDGYAFGIARARIHLGTVLAHRPGHLEEGRDLLAHGLAEARELRDRWGIAYALALLGLADHDLAQPAAARMNLRAALEVGPQAGVTSTAVLGLGLLAIANAPRRALRLFGAAYGIRDQTGPPRFPLLIERRLENGLGAARRRMNPRAGQLAFEEGRRMRSEEAMACGLEAAATDEGETSAALTGRQFDVAELVAAGLSNKEIAGQLRVSVRTVEKHVDDSLRRLTLHSRTQLAAWLRDAREGAPT